MTFEQSSESSPTTVSWDITGHDPNAERGMHIHQFGDNTNGCTSAGPHCMSPSFSLISPAFFPTIMNLVFLLQQSQHLSSLRVCADLIFVKSTPSANSMVLQRIVNATLETSETSKQMVKEMQRVAWKTNTSSSLVSRAF